MDCDGPTINSREMAYGKVTEDQHVPKPHHKPNQVSFIENLYCPFLQRRICVKRFSTTDHLLSGAICRYNDHKLVGVINDSIMWLLPLSPASFWLSVCVRSRHRRESLSRKWYQLSYYRNMKIERAVEERETIFGVTPATNRKNPPMPTEP